MQPTYYVAPNQRCAFRLLLCPLAAHRAATGQRAATLQRQRGSLPALVSGTAVLLRAVPPLSPRRPSGEVHPPEWKAFEGGEGGSGGGASPSPAVAAAPHDVSDVSECIEEGSAPPGGRCEGDADPMAVDAGRAAEGDATPPAQPAGPAGPAAGPTEPSYLRVTDRVCVASLPAWSSAAQRHLGAVTVEKPGGGPVFSGNTVMLRGGAGASAAALTAWLGEVLGEVGGGRRALLPAGRCLDVEGTAVAARWADCGEWQALRMELVPAEGAPTDRAAPKRGLATTLPWSLPAWRLLAQQGGDTVVT